VIVDTSTFTDELELLIGSIIINEIFNKYRRYKLEGDFDQKPVISIVVEEAPRVLSSEVLKSGKNIYSIIAREGRKFKVGLIAITQLTSIIPKTVLANMNTKIILGNELSSERNAIIESASQDLSTDDQNIASLDKGEAIVSSNFTKFAIPIKIPLFEDHIQKYHKIRPKEKTTFVG
jgi:DNA helicase HerA-like ATPase